MICTAITKLQRHLLEPNFEQERLDLLTGRQRAGRRDSHRKGSRRHVHIAVQRDR